VRRIDRRRCLFIEKQGRDKIKSTGTAGEVPKMVNGNAHSINPVVVHVPDHFLSGFILLLLFFLHLWSMVIFQIFSWRLLLMVLLINWLSFFWVHLLRILLIIGHQDGIKGGYRCRFHLDLFIRVPIMDVVVLFLQSILVASTGVRSLQTANHL
jgi:hypothetical protein